MVARNSRPQVSARRILMSGAGGDLDNVRKAAVSRGCAEERMCGYHRLDTGGNRAKVCTIEVIASTLYQLNRQILLAAYLQRRKRI